MSSSSRSLIISRRGTGITDLSNSHPENGELELDVAESNGILKINCTHTIGIATATEVGLPPSRFPVRVIIGADKFMKKGTDVVCRYWRITSSNSMPTAFQQKAIQHEACLIKLYSLKPDLDTALWSAFHQVDGTTYVDEISPDIAEANKKVHSYLILHVLDPEQVEDFHKNLDIIFQKSISQHRPVYIMLGENLYLKGLPHGEKFTAAYGINNNRIALDEYCATVALNYSRMHSRHDTVQSGLTTVASYAIASMFRLGLYEQYTNEEFYTVRVTPVEGVKGSYSIVSAFGPSGCEIPDDLKAGNKIDIDKFKLRPQLLEMGNLLVFLSGLMHYMHNHTTGGLICTGALLTSLCMYKFISAGQSDQEAIDATSVLYEALHPVNKRAIANLFFKRSRVYTYGRAANAPRFSQINLDAFAEIRTNPYPAGSHKAFVCVTALRKVLAAGLGPFLPWAHAISDVVNICKATLQSGARAHIGSFYYTGEPPIVQSSSLDNYLPELATYVNIFGKGDTLAMSPHLGLDIAARCSMQWSNLMKDLRAKDVSATSADKVREFLQAQGQVHFAFNPEDSKTWGSAAESSFQALREVESVFD